MPFYINGISEARELKQRLEDILEKREALYETKRRLMKECFALTQQLTISLAAERTALNDNEAMIQGLNDIEGTEEQQDSSAESVDQDSRSSGQESGPEAND
ncbi:hypothetical protein KIPB_002736 [Kipferlia bialata]|uniref:Uncharacterized protein n=1 Tax=Kipferlia bialata TaxID=797122 RepID=A0A391NUZ2_9EUKA|nr:hypothetical protein KIPB_002736 [Kipferlia bialata]|eukprot:g2736.t1